MPHFDLTVNLGNILTIGTFLLVAVLGWNNLVWRIKQLEDWRGNHEHSTVQALSNIVMLRENSAQLTALISGQDRRLQLLEDGHGGRPARA